MASTRAEQRADLRTELKKDPNGKIWNDVALNWYLKVANLKLQKDGNFQWRENQANTTFNTVVWTQEYVLPSDLWKVQLVRYNGSDLYNTTKVILKRAYSNFVDWTPSQYYLYGNNIWFDVIPNWTWLIDLDYQSRVPYPTDDTTQTGFPDDFDIAIIKYAAFLAWSSIDWKQATASSQLQEYQLEIDTLYNTYIFDTVEDLTFWMQRTNRNITRSNVLDR